MISAWWLVPMAFIGIFLGSFIAGLLSASNDEK